MSFSRELHLWLQSLDLSLPIKQPRRDFSNGYLIAELLSRYHPSLVDLHHYRQGSSFDSKLSNWAQLERALAKMQLDLPRPLIDALLHCQPNAHVAVLTRLYPQLTGRTLHPFQPPPVSSTAPPSFLASTASLAVKSRLLDSSVAGGLSPSLDSASTAQAAQAALRSHDEARREERVRQSTRIRAHLAQQRMVYHQLDKAAAAGPPAPPTAPMCSLKTVTVRQSATPLAAALPALQAQATKATPSRPSLSALNAVVVNSPHYSYHQTAPPFAEFIQHLPQLTDQAVAAVVDGVAADALDSLVANAAASPKDFYATLTLLFPLFTHCPLVSLGFQSALSLVTAWGHRLRAREAGLASALSLDFLLPQAAAAGRHAARQVARGAAAALRLLCGLGRGSCGAADVTHVPHRPRAAPPPLRLRPPTVRALASHHRRRAPLRRRALHRRRRGHSRSRPCPTRPHGG